MRLPHSPQTYLLFPNQPTGARIDAMCLPAIERATKGRIRASSYQMHVVRAPTDSYCALCHARLAPLGP